MGGGLAGGTFGDEMKIGAGGEAGVVDEEVAVASAGLGRSDWHGWAGRGGARAGVGRLVLVHAPYDASDDGLAEARTRFTQTSWGHDGDRVEV